VLLGTSLFKSKVYAATSFQDLGNWHLQITSDQYPSSLGWEVDNYKNTPDFIISNNLSTNPQTDTINLDHDGQRDGTYILYYCTTGQSQSECAESSYQSYNFVYEDGILTSSGSGGSSASTTRIISITSPLDNSVQNTSVTFSGTYYYNTDYRDATITPSWSPWIYIIINPKGQYSTTTYKAIQVPITSFNTVGTFSTTTTLEDNSRYVWTATIYCTRTYDAFTSCDETNHPGFYQFTTGLFDPTYGQNFDLSRCNPLNFDGVDCFYNLIAPNNAAFPRLMGEAKEAYARAWPIGYISRFMEIIASSSAIKPPFISIDLPVGGVLTLDPWDKLMGTTSIISQASSTFTLNGVTKGDGRSLRQITEPYWRYLWFFILGIAILRDILNKPTQGTIKQKEVK